MTPRPMPRLERDEPVSDEAHDAVTRAIEALQKLKQETERRRHGKHERRIATHR
jgi:hypothetical protein